jgi:hypothetical protein
MSSAMRLVFLVALGLLGCRALDPPNKPEAVCVDACKERAGQACSVGECRAGCSMMLDRMLEHEGEHVISCVSKSTQKRKCDAYLWAECAAKIGVHADGGPPVPPPLPEIDEE